MRRTALVALVPAVVIAATWLRLEDPRDDPNRVAAVVVLALVPALVRPRIWRIVALVLSLVVGARIAFGWWGHPIRVAAAFKNGFLDFYDVQVPFDPRVHAEMRSVILVAVFGFVLALGIAIAARRPLAATLVVLVGAGWPATLAGAAGGLGTGVAILVAVLVVLGGLTARRAPRTALVAGACLALAAFAVSSSSAVAKGELVALAGLGLLQRPRRTRERLVRLERAVRRDRLPNEADDGARDQGACHGALLAGRAARPVRRRPLDRGAADAGRFPRAARGARSNDVDPPETSPSRRLRTHISSARRRRRPSTPATRRSTGRRPAARRSPKRLTRGLQYTVWSYAPQPTPAELNRSQARLSVGAHAAARRCSTSGPASRLRRSGSHSARGS